MSQLTTEACGLPNWHPPHVDTSQGWVFCPGVAQVAWLGLEHMSVYRTHQVNFLPDPNNDPTSWTCSTCGVGMEITT